MNKITAIAMSLLALCITGHSAAATADEAAQLGKSLNIFGGDVSGNKDGTIPPYTGGYKANLTDTGPKRWTDPFAGEKPRLVITQANWQEHADKLLESQKEMFKRHKTFRMDVYPTHRTAWMPPEAMEQTLRNATSGRIAADGFTPAGVYGGLPFPIAKTGIEHWWNHELRYLGVTHDNHVNTYMVDAAGRLSLNSTFNSTLYYPYFDPKVGREEFIKGDGLYYKVFNDYAAPVSRVGETYLAWAWLDNKANPAKSWQYTPGTRRVRSAPDLYYDTPCPGYNGGITMDDLRMTYGPQDRFDWKLVGKQEKFILYSNYTQQFKTPSKNTLTPIHPNPDDMRWELHRVWVIEGKPKAGVRHIYSKKTLYLDEDNMSGNMETYDNAGKLYRAGWSTGLQLYDIGVQYSMGNFFFDFSSGAYWMGSHPADPSARGLTFPKSGDDGWRKKWLPMMTPEYLAANGIR